jgi:hypothetical protein
MKRYVTLKCSICTRQKDQLIDLTHYAPDRCVITLGCEGRLSPVGYTSDGTALLGVPPTGLSNWYPRGSTVTTTAAIQADSLYDTSTGTKKQLMIAVSDDALGFAPAATAVLTLNLEAEQQTAKDYRQYTYRRTSSFTVINGVEDGQAKKVLRYSLTGATPDQVEVYVNGVKRTLGVDYQLYDGTVGSAVPPNSVVFNTAVTGSSNQVDVIVTKASTVSAVTLTLARAIDDESRVGTGAWEGVAAVNSPSVGRWTVFYCDFAENGGALSTDVKLRVSGVSLKNTVGGPTYTVSKSAILLSRSKLYTQVDRHRSKWVALETLTSNTDYLVVKLVEGSRSLLVTEVSALDTFPPLEVVRFDTPSLLTSNLTGDDDAAELDNTLIIGPDA